jgi:hypothetical protein
MSYKSMEQPRQRRLHASVCVLLSILDAAMKVTSRSNPNRLCFVIVISWSNKKKGGGEQKDGGDFQDTKENYSSGAGMVDQKTLWNSYKSKSVFLTSSVFSLILPAL